jgi:hypothetical protein
MHRYGCLVYFRCEPPLTQLKVNEAALVK